MTFYTTFVCVSSFIQSKLTLEKVAIFGSGYFVVCPMQNIKVCYGKMQKRKIEKVLETFMFFACIGS